MHALISIHDVMPDTIGNVASILGQMPAHCRCRVMLLVVPGLPWHDDQIERLHAWQEAGITLAGHGWRHEATRISGFHHRLHSLLLSRQAAEHLALDKDQIADLLNRNHAWFLQQGLKPPDCYVPPAWTLGKAGADVLRDSPFRYFETTSGFYDSLTGRRIRLPLVGFEADTSLRHLALGLWNRCNRKLSTPRRPLRLAIHPHDRSLRLAPQLDAFLAMVSKAVDYHDLYA